MTGTGFRLFVPPPIRRLLRNFHPDLKQKTRAGFQAVLKNPRVGKPLKKELEGLYSYRMGRYRTIYRLQNKIVEIVAVGSRKNIYLDTLQCLKLEQRQK
ncbi:MAG: type II toxin-antitoxin system RelE/ParE family toxin [Deltaproteobacteria bacterium]|nr:type II toxin-antitoxin system RelE/ParE family toxin [Deltaproteobacteria bacterium]